MFKGRRSLCPPSSGHARGILAAAHNQLGEHERARAICVDVLERITDADLAYVWLNLNVQSELSLAEGRLGRFETASTRIDHLIARHAVNEGPLILGYLERARAELALREQDHEGCRRHLAEMERHFRITRIPSLLERVERLRRQLVEAERSDHEAPTGALLGDDVHLMTRVQLMMTNTRPERAERAHKALQIAVGAVGGEQRLHRVAVRSGAGGVLGDRARSELDCLGRAAPYGRLRGGRDGRSRGRRDAD